ncbi:hypothetical protein SDC9_212666 [bioreactor metagenome]|uniref:3-keto-disaccharide hydrolase domain-containing protein n=1 Tax=bioreactor metagenome TaxID=1076179 RepID=A0A645JMK3_9ZZZZ
MFGGEVIFNWEVRSNEFRCDIPLARGQHKRGAGNVPRGIWSEITIDVKDREIAFYVNGELRHTVRGNFRGISTKIGVTPCGDGSFWLSDFGVVK